MPINNHNRHRREVFPLGQRRHRIIPVGHWETPIAFLCVARCGNASRITSGSMAAMAEMKLVSDGLSFTHTPFSFTHDIQPEVPRPVTLNSQQLTGFCSGVTSFGFVSGVVIVEGILETVFRLGGIVGLLWEIFQAGIFFDRR